MGRNAGSRAGSSKACPDISSLRTRSDVPQRPLMAFPRCFAYLKDMRRMLMEHSELRTQGTELDLDVIGAASADVCILLTGPAAAAMELARRIHGLGRGRPGRFRAVNCG